MIKQKTILTLSKKESEAFIASVYGEVKCLVNEWDPDIARCPSQRRMDKKDILIGVEEKWKRTQPSFPGRPDLYAMSPAEPCTLELTDKEIKCCRRILIKDIKDARKALEQYSPPYTGALLEIESSMKCAEELLEKMQKA